MKMQQKLFKEILTSMQLKIDHLIRCNIERQLILINCWHSMKLWMSWNWTHCNSMRRPLAFPRKLFIRLFLLLPFHSGKSSALLWYPSVIQLIAACVFCFRTFWRALHWCKLITGCWLSNAGCYLNLSKKPNVAFWCLDLITTNPSPVFHKVFLAYSQAFEGYTTKATPVFDLSQTRWIRVPHLMWILTNKINM